MVSPTDGATGIGPQAIVTLTFSEPLLPSTTTSDTFSLFAGNNELSTSVTRSADNRTIFLTATLPFDTPITVVATGDVTDLAGNAARRVLQHLHDWLDVRDNGRRSWCSARMAPAFQPTRA